MAKTTGGMISRVRPGSIADEVGLRPGDIVCSVNGLRVRDVLEFQFLTAADEVEIGVQKTSGEEWLLELEKDFDEDIGLEFEEAIFDRLRTCRNNCVFCFVHQMPGGMRPSLNLKDDDYRLSFLHGNFITLTNLNDDDWRRILTQRLSPIHVSVHATDPELRRVLIGRAEKIPVLDQLRRLSDSGITLHTQIVLCPGLNDGHQLDRTIGDLAGLPEVHSVAVVPVGLTKFRDRLYPLRPFDRPGASNLLDQIDFWQSRLRKTRKRYVVYAADEFYVLAGREVPPARFYEGYPQLENGVGLIRVFLDEWTKVEQRLPQTVAPLRRVTLITGVSAAPTLRKVIGRLSQIPGLQVDLVTAENRFFGPTVTVAGLLTGADIVDSLRGRDLGDEVLIPGICLKEGDEVTLDGISPAEMARELGVPVRGIDNSARLLVKSILGLIYGAE